MVVDKIEYEKKVMSYLSSHNFTNPHCYGKYQAIVSRNITGLEIQVGLDSNEYLSSCNTIPSKYYKCTAKDFASQMHPCMQIKSYFHLFFILNE